MWRQGLKFIEDMERKGQAHRMIHIEYRDLVKDPIGTVGKIHQAFDLAPVNVAALDKWLADNPQGKHGMVFACSIGYASVD
jgi:hypothetical protein